MESSTTNPSDNKFKIGVSLMILGYAVINILIFLAVFGLPFYVVGMILVLLSRKSWTTKLLITISPLVINYYSVIALLSWLGGSSH